MNALRKNWERLRNRLRGDRLPVLPPQEGYDRWAASYEDNMNPVQTLEAEALARLLPELHDRVVLDLGCGAGVPTTRQLAEHFTITGVDISKRQIDRARYNVPNATFMQADMAELEFPPDSFDAVTAFYSIIHLPRDEQPKLLQSIATWLRPGGLLMATMGANSTEVGFEEIWLGTSMYWSHFDSETNKRLLEDAGFRLISAGVKTSESSGESETFLWVVAQKPENS